jgi:hypothetical protein
MSALALVTVMPFCRTLAGSWGSATAIAFCTSTAARSWSREMSNVTDRFITPSLELDDL